MPILTEKDFANAKRDIDDIGKSINTESIINPRWGKQFKSIPLIANEGQSRITELNNAINQAAAAGAGANGWTDQLVLTWSGRSQEQRNKDQINLSDYKKPSNTYTQALQDAINYNPKRCIHVSSGVYELSSVNIPHSISFMCEQGVVFKRGNNLDIRQGAWNDGTAMFEAKAQGISILFFGGMTFDGNNQNQLNRFQEPTGYAVKIQPPENPSYSEIPVYLYMQNPKFQNGTSGYLCVRGDDVNRRYLTKVVLDNPLFTDTLMGTGKGDPLALNPLGWQPDYCTVYDYVHFITNNLTMQYSKVTGMGEYAPVGIRGTFFGTSFANSGECSLFLNGLTTLKNMGRSGKLYNNNSDYLTNNGIGVIDVYGNGETLYVENVEATDSQNVTIRAKASVKNYTVKNAVLKNCHRGLQVSASTTGAGEAVVDIGSLTSYGGTIPQLEITGTSAADRVRSATVGAVKFFGTFRNPENLAQSSHGNFHARNVVQLISSASDIESSPLCAMRLQDIDVASIFSPTAKSNNPAVLSLGVKTLNIYTPRLSSTGGAGISIQASASTPTIVNVSGGSIDSAVDNGILNAANNASITVDSLAVKGISGLSRGFSNTVGSIMKLSKCSTNATTPVVKNGSQIFEFANSWNPNIQYGAVYTTTIGKNKKGDIVYNTAPSASGNVGWICVTGDGTDAGTWKTFGNIAT